MDNSNLTISLAQYDIAWEDKEKNLTTVKNILSKLAGTTDIVVLPEMSFTGFSLNMAAAEAPDGDLFTRIKQLAQESGIAVCGSVLTTENGNHYNRGFFITPTESYFYDKRHLFRMGGEGRVITAGREKTIFNYKGFNINLQVCYDLRFPVWSRNVDNEYDLAIYVANWPEPRKKVWDILLKARAVENSCYVCGVNRVGRDNNNLSHSGLSTLIDAKGESLILLPENKEAVESIIIDKASLNKMRAKFPTWRDADKFEIKY